MTSDVFYKCTSKIGDIMKFIFVTMLFVLFTGCATKAVEPETVISEESQDPEIVRVLEAVEKIRNTPFGEDMTSVFRLVLRFATESTDVQVEISEENCPWVGQTEEGDRIAGILLIAYIAGSVEWQLMEGISDPDYEAGKAMVRHVYEKAKELNPGYEIESLENPDY